MIGQGKIESLCMLVNCFTILANLFYKWYKCFRMLANTVANLTNMLQMKREQVLYLPASVQSAYFPSNLYSLSTIVLHSTEMSIRMLGNLYNRLTTTSNAFPTIRLACDWLQICCEWLQICCVYAFLANFRSMFLKFATPQKLFKPMNAW